MWAHNVAEGMTTLPHSSIPGLRPNFVSVPWHPWIPKRREYPRLPNPKKQSNRQHPEFLPLSKSRAMLIPCCVRRVFLNTKAKSAASAHQPCCLFSSFPAQYRVLLGAPGHRGHWLLAACGLLVRCTPRHRARPRWAQSHRCGCDILRGFS